MFAGGAVCLAMFALAMGSAGSGIISLCVGVVLLAIRRILRNQAILLQQLTCAKDNVSHESPGSGRSA